MNMTSDIVDGSRGTRRATHTRRQVKRRHSVACTKPNPTGDYPHATACRLNREAELYRESRTGSGLALSALVLARVCQGFVADWRDQTLHVRTSAC